MTAARVCPTHPDARWITVQHWTHCVACENARKREWTRQRRQAGLLPASSPEGLAKRREREAAAYNWKRAHHYYAAWCDAQGIPATKETA